MDSERSDPLIDYVHPDLIAENTNTTSVQDAPENQKCSPINRVLILLLVLALLATAFGLFVIIVQYAILPNRVQQSIDDSHLTISQSVLTEPEDTSVLLTSTLTSDASPPYKSTVAASVFTFRWCNPTDVKVPFTVDYNCTLDSDETILGQVSTPDFEISSPGPSPLNINSRFEILNMTNFATFSRFLFFLPNLTWQAEASMDITVTVMGIKFKSNGVSFKKNTTLSGLNSLPGVFTADFTFQQNTTISKDLPQINLTAHVFNPGTTSFVPLGDLRYEYFYAGKNFTYQNQTVPYGHIGSVMSPNASIFSGETSVPTFGSIVAPQQPGYYYNALANLLQSIINGVNDTEIICWNTHNWDACCNYTIPPIPPHNQYLLSSYFESRGYPSNLVEQLSTSLRLSRGADCVCTNASSIPLYNNFMQGLVLFMHVRLSGPSPLLFNISLEAKNLAPDASIPLTLNLTNPFGVPIEIDSIQVNLTYQEQTAATFSAANTIPHTKLVVVGAYSSVSFAPTQRAKFSKDLSQDLITALQAGTTVIGGLNGVVEFKLMNAPVLISNYTQTVLPIVPLLS